MSRQPEAQSLLNSDASSADGTVCCQPKTKLQGALYCFGCIGFWGAGIWALNAYAVHTMSTGCAAGFGLGGGAIVGVKGCCPIFCCNDKDKSQDSELELTVTSSP